MRRKSTWLFVCLLILRCSVADAQTRTSIRLEPKPDQTVHVTTTQEFAISFSGGAAAGEAPPEMLTETVLGYTQVNGPFDDQNRMESQLTLERIEMRQSINGIAKPLGNIAKLQGRSLTAVFDRGGKLVDLKVPQDLQDASSVLKQMVAFAYSALSFLPPTAMSVGDTETAPSTIPLRLPGSATPLPYQTRTATTLRAVEKNGGDRVARLEQLIQSAGSTDLLKVKGTGTIEVNLDRGFVAATTTEWSFEGDDKMAQTGTASPLGAVHGTIRVTVASHE
jgi:hypothetical protein